MQAQVLSLTAYSGCGGIMTRLGIVGYGNLGKAVERIVCGMEDISLVGVFTRRDPLTLRSPYGTVFYNQKDLKDFAGQIDVLALCTGSSKDLVDLALDLARNFNTIDTFDNHEVIGDYLIALDKVTKTTGRLSFVGAGWDPGLFSMMRALFEVVLPDGATNTFWGEGVSQGHGEAVRKIKGVKKAVQYTIPKAESVALAIDGATLTAQDRHRRECFVVVDDGADLEYVENQIKTMPNYFDGYDTVVNFIDDDEFDLKHTKMNHGGVVMRSGVVGGQRQILSFDLKLDSNPDFTASVVVAYVKCLSRLYQRGERGARTILDVSINDLIGGDNRPSRKYL